MSEKIKWGFMGAGNIARLFAQGLDAVDNAEIVAVGCSFGQESADKFGDEFDIPKRYPNFELLAEDKDIDVIYVATPNIFHKENTLLCLKNKKHVLCEKPFAINSNETREMLEYAKEKDKFLMEAMWMYFFPAMAKIRELLVEKAIGNVHMVNVEFSSPMTPETSPRVFNKSLGGGVLYDLGVYAVAFSHMVFNSPVKSTKSEMEIGTTGIDEQTCALLNFESGGMAVLSCSTKFLSPHQAVIYGSEGWIKVPHMFWQPDEIVICRGGQEETFSFPRLGNGYSFEAAEVMKCIREGKRESDIMPLQKSTAIMATLDRIRQQCGFRYSSDK